VVDATRAEAGFHARYDAVLRSYRYLVMPRRQRRPVGRQYAWRIDGPMDLEAMRAAAAVLCGRHDFGALGTAPRPGGSTVRTIAGIDVRRVPLTGGQDAAVLIEVRADAFLYGMMRNIARLLVDIGRGRRWPDQAEQMLRDPHADHRMSPAPACGLHQWRVIYSGPTGADVAVESA
jgi:tRNA pseudouridine38-40 synthase